MSDSSILRPSRYRYSFILLKQLVKTDFKLRYQGSFLGYIWSLLKPTALFGILYVVFSLFLRIGDTVPNFPVYLLLGIVIWNYFSEVTLISITSIVTRGEILRRLNFPRYVIVLSTSFSALINLALNMLVVIGFIYFSDIDITPTVLWLPFLLIQLFIFSLGVSFFLSAAFVKFRDISYIWEVALQGAFYATPILYPVSFISDYSETATKILMLNPVAQMIQDFRFILVTDQSTRIDQVYDSHWIRLVPIGLTLLIAILASAYFRSRSKYFAEEL